MMDKVKKRKIVLVNFRHAVFSLLYTHDDLMMQAFVWHHTVQFTVQNDLVWCFVCEFKTSHIAKHQI